MAKPTQKQWKELHKLAREDRFTQANMKKVLVQYRDPTKSSGPELAQITMDTKGVTIIELDHDSLGDEPIMALIREIGPEKYADTDITDKSFTTNEEGVVRLGYKSFPGKNLKPSSDWVWKKEVEKYFKRRGMRFAANMVEALIVVAKDKQFGRTPSQVIFIQGSPVALMVIEHEQNRLVRLHSSDGWRPELSFVGFCE